MDLVFLPQVHEGYFYFVSKLFLTVVARLAVIGSFPSSHSEPQLQQASRYTILKASADQTKISAQLPSRFCTATALSPYQSGINRVSQTNMSGENVSGPPLPTPKTGKPVSEALLNEKASSLYTFPDYEQEGRPKRHLWNTKRPVVDAAHAKQPHPNCVHVL
jgi:hypothetical protein